MSAKPKVPEGYVGVPFIEDEIRAGKVKGGGTVLYGPCRIDTSDRELEALYAATIEAEHVILTVNRVSKFMQVAIDGGFAEMNDAASVFELISLATDPTPSLAAEKATLAADNLRRRQRTKPEEKP